ncbi:type II toxin-antitoxin system YafQ family toxin [Parabacteroides sp. GYB001]|uniref:type II toxin-antitoxin system RelE/ParE family toxin n=1 Tax=Parabacteroides leei TaxID=2939491 RepID=UPI002017D059|nr:type II toxin-antitoxin system YafQ family toxin [Parabacteroides leei]MCL3852823.1 type II toxin-antitoxin system YafQ family toxin [Parabacteroides leei]
MYELEYANSFEKDLKRCKKRGYNLQLLQEAIDILQEKGELPAQYRPHKLSGKLAGLWECHIKGDWLLIWLQNDTELILIMTDTGTHSDLF